MPAKDSIAIEGFGAAIGISPLDDLLANLRNVPVISALFLRVQLINRIEKFQDRLE
jgi:hypothetical protein